MHIHVALFQWKSGVAPQDIRQALQEVEGLQDKIPGVVEICTGENTSQYAEGYTHVVLVRAKTKEAIDAYRKHPDHVAVAKKIEAMEQHGIGVDFETETKDT